MADRHRSRSGAEHAGLGELPTHSDSRTNAPNQATGFPYCLQEPGRIVETGIKPAFPAKANPALWPQFYRVVDQGVSRHDAPAIGAATPVDV